MRDQIIEDILAGMSQKELCMKYRAYVPHRVIRKLWLTRYPLHATNGWSDMEDSILKALVKQGETVKEVKRVLEHQGFERSKGAIERRKQVLRKRGEL